MSKNVCTSFPFGFKGGMSDLIVSILDFAYHFTLVHASVTKEQTLSKPPYQSLVQNKEDK